MRIAVFILALIGGIIALFGTMAGAGLTGAAGALGGLTEAQTTEYGGRIFLGFGAAIATIIFGSLVLAKKGSGRWWGLALIVVSIAGMAAAGGFYLFGGLLALVAGLLALFIGREKSPERGIST